MSAVERIKEIFSQALEKKDRPERDVFLAEECGGDAEVQYQVESLLLAHEGAGAFLRKTIPLPPSDFMIERSGTMVGRYKLLQRIGENGFGVVCMAQQIEPVQRKVALKVIKAGMDTREVVARFAAERQALALMDHPNNRSPMHLPFSQSADIPSRDSPGGFRAPKTLDIKRQTTKESI